MQKEKYTRHQLTLYVVYTAKHIPSGEEWVLLGISKERDQVCAAGWPPSMGKLSDCTDVVELRPMTVEEYHYRRNHFGYGWDDKKSNEPEPVSDY